MAFWRPRRPRKTEAVRSRREWPMNSSDIQVRVEEGDEKTRWQLGPQQGDLRLLSPPSGQSAGSGARTRDRKVSADLGADSLATVPPKPPNSLASWALQISHWFGLICYLYTPSPKQGDLR
ncbi:hypothetical protein PoB_004813000 [Plakobranchus ocellatus]|uniref:Uncharacterized protein n=1 Tax=Plakobranchus ocellatus TaxID=259542 RepID=A0AAV4BM65_9GAST|nr:hypothetical protein PoB_004813000 [Plakobranchus ocellatus]